MREEGGGHAFRPRVTTKKAGFKARSAPAMFAPPICRRGRRNVLWPDLAEGWKAVVSSDTTKTAGFPANIAVREASDWPERAEASGAIEYRASEASGAIRY